MNPRCSIALVGDFNPAALAHQAIPLALDLASADLGVHTAVHWVPTANIKSAADDLGAFQGIWCVPASPYQNTAGALTSIRWARERKIPFLGTCGGFQHALVEYARNVLGTLETAHAETDPGTRNPLIAPLACSLVEVEEEVLLEPGSILHKSYGLSQTREGYHCSYGLNPEREREVFDERFRVNARDRTGQVRGGELLDHPFFVGTLFQSERRALRGQLPPLVRQFVRAVHRLDTP